MKTTLLFFLIVLLAACGEKTGQDGPAARPAASAGTKQLDSAHLLRPGFAGQLRLGAFSDTLGRIFPAERIGRDTIRGERRTETVYVISDQKGSPILRVEQDCRWRCRVARITVLSAAYRMPDGTGIGSRYGDLKKRYKISWTDMNQGLILARAEDLGMSFFFPPVKFPPAVHREPMIPIPDTSRIVQIVFSDPERYGRE